MNGQDKYVINQTSTGCNVSVTVQGQYNINQVSTGYDIEFSDMRWILFNAKWNDDKIWVDSAKWRG
jgi:hypothetical protein